MDPHMKILKFISETAVPIDINEIAKKNTLTPKETMKYIRVLVLTNLVSARANNYAITEKGKTALKTVPPMTKAARFNFYAGIDQPLGLSAETVNEFLELTQIINLKSLEFHLYREDFENWFKTSINDPLFAQEITLIRKANLKGEELRKAILEAILLRKAAEAVGEIGNYDSKEWLFLALKSSNFKFRLAARDALVKSLGDLMVSRLILTLQYSDPWVRAAGAYTLGQIGDERAIEKLMILLKDYNLSVKLEARDALIKFAQTRSKPVVNTLISGLQNHDQSICDEVALVLSAVNDDSATSALQLYNEARQLTEEGFRKEKDQEYWQKIFSEEEEEYREHPFRAFEGSKWQEDDYAIAGALFLARRNFRMPLFAILEKSDFNQTIVDAIQDVIKIGKGTDIISFRVLDQSVIWVKHGRAFCDCSHSDGYGRFDFYADEFLDNPPCKELNNRGLWVFTISKPIVTTQMRPREDRDIGGLAKPLTNALISTAVQTKLQDQLQRKLGNLGNGSINEFVLGNLKMIVFHEMGHLFGAPSYKRIVKNKKIEQNYGYHCADRNCVMSQEKETFSIEDWLYAAKNQTLPPPDKAEFCKQCRQDVEHFFDVVREAQKAKKKERQN